MQKSIKDFTLEQFKKSFNLRFYSYSLIIFKFTMFDFLMNYFCVYNKTNYYNICLDLNILYKTAALQKYKYNGALNFLNYHCGLSLIVLKDNTPYYKKYINCLNYSFICSLIGSIISLDVIGYIRRAWYRKKKNILYFRLGYSCFTKLVLNKVLILNLIKKRFLNFFSVQESFLFFQVSLVRNLIKTNLYKYSGILYNLEYVELKKSKKQKVGSSY